MTSETTAPRGIDPRAPRFGAAITAALLLVGVALSLVSESATTLRSQSLLERVGDPAFILLVIVAALFAWSLLAPASQPVALLYRKYVAPKIGAPREYEDPRPPRFAQLVGLIVVGVGLVLHLVGVPWALTIAAAAAFVAAFLNAAFGYCIGCELYLLLQRAGVVGR